MCNQFLYFRNVCKCLHRVFIGLPLVWLAMDAGEQEERAEVENHPGRHNDGDGGVDDGDGDGGVDDSDGKKRRK